MEEEKQIKDYIVDYLLEGGEMDAVLADWLAASEANRLQFEQYKQIWNESRLYMSPDAFDADRAWQKIQTANRRRSRWYQLGRNALWAASGVAASLLVLLVLSLSGVFHRDTDWRVSMKADCGSRSEVRLPDGTFVRLNSGSDVTYHYNGKEKRREVCFQGEGFFDVAKSEEPFVIQLANGLKVRVWGTSFNLQAYENEPFVQASLVEGSIELESSSEKRLLQAYENEPFVQASLVEGSIELESSSEKRLMKPGEMVVYDKQTQEMKPVDGSVSHTYGWLDNKLYMDDMPLSTICKYLERWYNVQITLQPGLEGRRYNGVIQEETIGDVLNALSRLSNIDYQVKGKHIRITSKN